MTYLVEEWNAPNQINIYRRIISFRERRFAETAGYFACTSIKRVPWEDFIHEGNLIYFNLVLRHDVSTLQKYMRNSRLSVGKSDLIWYSCKTGILTPEEEAFIL